MQGQSGSGKTLLLRAIADLDPYKGDISLGTVACNEISPASWRKTVSLLPAENRWWHNSVGEHFTTNYPELKKNLVYFGFDQDVLKWQTSRLSSGEKQRLAILRLLQNQPAALLLDEPTANLDPETTILVESLLNKYQIEKQTPVLWVSHAPEQLQRVADQQMCMHKDGTLTVIE